MLNLLRKHPLIAVLVPITIGLLVWGFWPQPVLVEVVEVSRAPLVVTIEEEGRTRVIDRYIISAPMNGITCRQHLKVGDPVQKDQTLLSITPLESQILDPRSRAQAQAQIAAAQSALQAAKQQASAASAAATRATNEHKRLQPLMKQSLISRDLFDNATTEMQARIAIKRSADFNVEVARYELEAARTVIDQSAERTTDLPREHIPVRAPIDGQILKVARDCDGPVRTGEPLLEVGDPSALEIEVDLLSADAVKIKSGMKVLFDRWGGDQILEGTVHLIEPVGTTKVSALGVEEQRVLVISKLTTPTEIWTRLGDGYRVEARFILWQQQQILQVPESSLFRYKNGWALFIASDGYAKRRIVKTGKRNGLMAQILEGVAEGEMVINHPSDNIEDGRSIKFIR